ncbi:MAG: TonB-dependent receptor [Bacteroidota bacterium]
MFRKLMTALLIALFGLTAATAQTLTGTIYGSGDNNGKSPLPGASVYWRGTTTATSTDANGHFSIVKLNGKNARLVISMIGYKADTIILEKDARTLEHTLALDNLQLKGVEIHDNQESNYISKVDPRKVQILTTNEFYKAACCNLAESFETNASVDVSYSDAITGARQIQLLGLSGIYSQIQTENIPSVRGLASTFGLNYIPGAWMESIQISKGTSSVINGFESVTGQINVEYKKPATADKVFINVYGNSNKRFEANATGAWKINDKLSTMLMLSGSDYRDRIDHNHDNFLDIPKLTSINVFNRWDYINPGKFVSRFGIKYMQEDRSGGTMDYNHKTFVDDTALINKGTEPYGFGLKTARAEAFWKNGLMYKDKPYKSLALILSGIYHKQEGYFGLSDYSGTEKNFYANLLYQSIIGNTNHKFTTGLSFIYDDYIENYNQKLYIYNYQITGILTDASLFTINHSVLNYYNWNRTEIIPGAFFEYTYNYKEKFSLIAGLRADYHNKYGLFFTPRMNLKYKINDNNVIRASAGMGYRTPNVISENLSLLASQRSLVFREDMKQEQAVNFGINYIKEFKMFKRKAEVDIDVYRTQFLNQAIVDLDSTPTVAYFYNLKGKSYSNSYQAQFSFEPVKRLSILLAYRINDVKTTINGKLQQRPMINNYKGLVTLSYATRFEKWKFDFTAQFNGKSRLPNQELMPEKIKRPATTPEYILLNAQITKKFRNFDVYIGSENLTNFTQKDPITEYFRPYHTHFDTSMVWGPVTGRVIYAGFRYRLRNI